MDNYCGVPKMKKRYLIQFGEWVSVYQRVTGYIDCEEEPTKENFQKLIDENNFVCISEDRDNDTAENIEYDTESFMIVNEDGGK